MTTAVATSFDRNAWPLEAVPCNLCGGTDVDVVTERDRYGWPTRIVQCRTCALRYITPRFSREGYAAFYADGYRPLLAELRGRPYAPGELEFDQRMYAAELVAQVKGQIPPHPRLVDLGGSTGIVSRHFMASCGAIPTVVEPCLDELQHAKDCIKVFASAEDVDFPPNTFDLVLCCRTVDHLLDPVGVLRRARAWVPSTGRLIVDAMDVDHWPEKYRYKVDHPYAFTAETLRAVVAAAGWTVRHTWTRRKGQYVGYLCAPQE
jgi:SAM-dependent methyltransferase